MPPLLEPATDEEGTSRSRRIGAGCSVWEPNSGRCESPLQPSFFGGHRNVAVSSVTSEHNVARAARSHRPKGGYSLSLAVGQGAARLRCSAESARPSSPGSRLRQALRSSAQDRRDPGVTPAQAAQQVDSREFP